MEVLVSTNTYNQLSYPVVRTLENSMERGFVSRFPQPTRTGEGFDSMFSRPCSSLALLPAFPRFLSKSCTFGAAFSVPVLLGPAPLSLFFAMLHRVMSHDNTHACSLSSPPLNALLQVCPAALAVGWSYACCSQTLAIRLFVSGHESKARQTARHESQNCLFVCANKNGARSIVKMGRSLD